MADERRATKLASFVTAWRAPVANVVCEKEGVQLHKIEGEVQT
jgi:hypothetical protein